MCKRTKLTFAVPKICDNILLKDFLKNHCNISVQLLINLKKEFNGICVNGKHSTVIERVKKDDVVVLTLPIDTNEIKPVKMNLDIKYEDEHLLIINKPSNMPVHPTSCGHYDDTLANAVSYYMAENKEMYAVRAINRLDKDTTGLVVVAKNSYSAYTLGTNIEKTYIAVCQGEIKERGTIDIGIKREEGRSIQRIADTSGQQAITHYKPLEYKKGYTLVELQLETGRTHQIRVHMSHIGYPLAGDDMYNGKLDKISHQALHCKKLKFTHPVTKKAMHIVAEPPKEFDVFEFNKL